MKYKKIYSFQVVDKIMEGEKVYMLDKQSVTALCVNDLSVGCLAVTLTDEDTAGRYEFWIVEEAE